MAKQKDKGSLFFKILITVSVAWTGSIAACEATSKIMTDQYKTYHRQNFKEFEDIMLQNKDGLCLILPKQKNPITVALENFSNEEKQLIKDAIMDLDYLLPNIDYKVLDNPETNQYVQLRIENANDFDCMAIAETKVKYNRIGQIVFPMSMKINIDDVNYWDRCGTYEFDTLLTHIVKHEMLHTLGFKDIYDHEAMGKTIMYYSMGDPSANYDKYTITDIDNINKIYNSGIVEKKFPTFMIYTQELNKTSIIKEDELTPLN